MIYFLFPLVSIFVKLGFLATAAVKASDSVWLNGEQEISVATSNLFPRFDSCAVPNRYAYPISK